MLIPSFFIPLIDRTTHIINIAYPENIYPACKIRIGDINHAKSLYNSLFTRRPEAPFFLFVEFDDRPFEETEIELFIDYAISFSFHYKYLNLNFKTPFLLFKTSNPRDSVHIPLFREKFQAQGYIDIDYVLIDAGNSVCNSSHAGKWISLNSANDTEDLASAYKEVLNSGISPESSLLFFVHPVEQLPALIGSMLQAENSLLHASPYVYSLLYKCSLSETKLQKLQSEAGLLKEDLDSLKNYYAFYNQPDSGYKKKVIEIVEFYKNEYEILPLWYKQFGHFIKVLTGKRTFRSLFNDNVKKYKQ